jgi:uncharacterized Ntn-hydrolase superfamily protein
MSIEKEDDNWLIKFKEQHRESGEQYVSNDINKMKDDVAELHNRFEIWKSNPTESETKALIHIITRIQKMASNLKYNPYIAERERNVINSFISVANMMDNELQRVNRTYY